MTGALEAVVATTGALIKDAVLLPGCIRDLRLAFVSAWDHSVQKDQPPVGLGQLSEIGNKIVFQGRFDKLHTPYGRLAYENIQRLGVRIRWSIGFQVLEWGHIRRATYHPGEEGVARAITRINLFEISPILTAADPSTFTIRCGSYRCPSEFREIPSLKACIRWVRSADPRKHTPQCGDSRRGVRQLAECGG